MESISDEALVEAYRAGEEAAFELLVRRHTKSIYNLALRLGADEHAACDISQDAFLKAWKNIKKFNPKSASFRTWLLAIARNTTIDFLRKRKDAAFSYFELPDGSNMLTDALPDEAPLPDEEFAAALNARTLNATVRELPLGTQDILRLYYREGLTLQEIGYRLCVPLNTIKSRHRRAIIALRNLLTQRHQNAL